MKGGDVRPRTLGQRQGRRHRHKIVLCPVAGDPGGGMGLQEAAQHEDFGDAVGAQVRQRETPAGAFQIAFRDKLHQRLAHGHPADAHLCRDGMVDQAGARRDLALQEARAQDVMDARAMAGAGHWGQREVSLKSILFIEKVQSISRICVKSSE